MHIETFVSAFGQNTYLCTHEGKAFVIDPGADARKIKDYLKEHGLDLVGVLLTHGHYDHTYTLNDILDIKSVPVFIHEAEEDFLYDESLNLSMHAPRTVIAQQTTEVKTLKDNDIIDIAGVEISVVHTPGHTRGSVCFAVENVLFTGDLVFEGAIGRTDLPTGDYDVISKSLLALVERFNDDTVLYPGHGPVTTLGKEKKGNPLL